MEALKNRILVVEDNKDIREAICVLLNKEGYESIGAKDGKTALAQNGNTIDLVILDIMMPGISGIEVCRKIREISNIPILFLTAKSGTMDKTEGLLAGGDDYLVKPFDNQELLARIVALLRRYYLYQGNKEERDKESFLIAGELMVSEQYNEVFRDKQKIELPDIEYRMLKLFMKHRSKILSAQNIFESVWDEPYFYDSNNKVMVHIRKLRMKIEDDPQKPVYILTEWGRGYRFGK
jgi:two-component system OmpR family response regulator